MEMVLAQLAPKLRAAALLVDDQEESVAKYSAHFAEVQHLPQQSILLTISQN
jgi:hypothetical protein